jgi:hypothetical protein
MPRFLRATRVLPLHGGAFRQTKRAEKLRITGLKIGKSELRNNFRPDYTTDASREVYVDVHNRRKIRDGLYEKGLTND